VCFWIIASLTNSGESVAVSAFLYLSICISGLPTPVSCIPRARDTWIYRHTKYMKKCESWVFVLGAMCTKRHSKIALQATGNSVNRLHRNWNWITKKKICQSVSRQSSSIILIDSLMGEKSFTRLRKSQNWRHQFCITLGSVSNLWGSRSWKVIFFNMLWLFI